MLGGAQHPCNVVAAQLALTWGRHPCVSAEAVGPALQAAAVLLCLCCASLVPVEAGAGEVPLRDKGGNGQGESGSGWAVGLGGGQALDLAIRSPFSPDSGHVVSLNLPQIQGVHRGG